MSIIAFTVGHTESYDRALSEGGTKKKGRGEGYGGGWVWADQQDAAAFLATEAFADTDRDARDYSVYQLALPNGWDQDVTEDPDPSDGVHRLLNDAPVVCRMLLVRQSTGNEEEQCAH